MKRDIVVSVYIWVLTAIFFGLVVHAPMMVFMSSRFPEFSLLFKSWKEILLLLEVGIGVYLLIRGGLLRQFLNDKLVVLGLIYCGFTFLVAVLSFVNWRSFGAGLMIDLRYVVFMLLVMAAVKIKPDVKKLMMKSAVVGALIVVVFGLLQVVVLPDDVLTHIGYGPETIEPYMTVDDNPDYVRINSTLRGPNVLGAYGVIVVSLAVAYLWQRLRGLDKKRRKKQEPRPVVDWKVALSVFSVFGGLVCLWFSYSRAALLGLGVVVGFLAVRMCWDNKRLLKWLVGGFLAIAVVLGGLVVVFRDSAFVANVVFHDDVEHGAEETSNDGHAESLVEGIKKMIESPLGSGVGSTGSASLFTDKPVIVENQFLFVAYELGWLGLGMFIGMLVVLGRRLASGRGWMVVGVLASGIGLLVVGVFLPVFADETVSMTWFGLAGVLASGGSSEEDI